jgi:hypothetical protein
MKKFTLIGLLCAAFLLGYGFSRVTNTVNSGPRVTGIGGIFFKAKDPAALKAWYSKNLGIRIGDSVQILNGTRAWTAQKKALPYGRRLKKPPNTLSPLKSNS